MNSPKSWIIVDPATGNALAEFWNTKFLHHVKLGLQVMTAQEYLEFFNSKVNP